jgi:hypothetical protein
VGYPAARLIVNIFSVRLSISAAASRFTHEEMSMKYMMLIYLDEKALDDVTRDKCYVDSAAYAHALHAQGKFLDAAPLHPTATATSIRIREGKPLVTDGPFAETREQLGGFFLVDAENLDEAIRIAAQIPAGRYGTVEIRPVLEVPGLPGEELPEKELTEKRLRSRA